MVGFRPQNFGGDKYCQAIFSVSGSEPLRFGAPPFVANEPFLEFWSEKKQRGLRLPHSAPGEQT